LRVSEATVVSAAGFAQAVETIVENCGEGILSLLLDDPLPSTTAILNLGSSSIAQQRHCMAEFAMGRRATIAPMGVDPLNRLAFSEIPPRLRRAIRSLRFGAVVLLREEDATRAAACCELAGSCHRVVVQLQRFRAGGVPAQFADVLARPPLDGEGLVPPRRAGAGVDAARVANHVGHLRRALDLELLAVLEVGHHVVSVVGDRHRDRRLTSLRRQVHVDDAPERFGEAVDRPVLGGLPCPPSGPRSSGRSSAVVTRWGTTPTVPAALASSRRTGGA
jgi:hypothetical protein